LGHWLCLKPLWLSCIHRGADLCLPVLTMALVMFIEVCRPLLILISANFNFAHGQPTCKALYSNLQNSCHTVIGGGLLLLSNHNSIVSRPKVVVSHRLFLLRLFCKLLYSGYYCVNSAPSTNLRTSVRNSCCCCVFICTHDNSTDNLALPVDMKRPQTLDVYMENYGCNHCLALVWLTLCVRFLRLQLQSGKHCLFKLHKSSVHWVNQVRAF
jgi:hypothetical protein